MVVQMYEKVSNEARNQLSCKILVSGCLLTLMLPINKITSAFNTRVNIFVINAKHI